MSEKVIIDASDMALLLAALESYRGTIGALLTVPGLSMSQKSDITTRMNAIVFMESRLEKAQLADHIFTESEKKL